MDGFLRGGIRTQRRPIQDDTIWFPCFRQLYSASFLGRPEDPHHEEPIKYTQALANMIVYETCQEWAARLTENAAAADLFIKGELAKEAEKLAAIKGGVSEDGAGESDLMGKVESLEEITTLEDSMEEDMFTTYGFHPPIFNFPIRLSPAIITMMYGNSNV